MLPSSPDSNKAMDKRVIETIVRDERAELKAKRGLRLCRRRETVLIDMDSTLAQVIIGLRRSGKSTLCYSALEEAGVKYAYVNFDDERLATITVADLNDVLEVLYKVYGDFTHLFIDEIQNIDGWYLFVNRLLRQGQRIIVTGSNAKLLSGELATHLTGRNMRIELYTLSFREYCELTDVETGERTTKGVALLRAAFDEYMRQGGFPELIHVRNKRAYVDNLVDNILKRDIEQRYRVQYKAALETMAHHLLNTAPTIVSDAAIQENFGLKSVHTAKNYVGYLKQAYLLIGLHKYSAKSKLRLTGEKLYPADVALMAGRADAFSGDNLGWRLETIVYIELLRRYRPAGYDIYYLADRSGECDFIVCQDNKALMAVQVAYDISNPRTLKREKAGLLLAARKTNCNKLLLLTDHEYADITEQGQRIAIRPVYEWALDDEEEQL